MSSTLRLGATGAEVRQLQAALNSALGLSLLLDGSFGPTTQAAVIAFQKKRGILADGIAGVVTQNALLDAPGYKSPTVAAVVGSKKLVEADYVRAATALGVSVAHVKTVCEVEARGTGFLSDGRPKILFERHVFYKRIDADKRAGAAASCPDLCNSVSGGYIGNAAEYQRLERAQALDHDGALESCSWGLFQIMGYHWKALGYRSVFDFVEANQRCEGEQLDAFVRFVLLDKTLLTALRTNQWATFARAYNGKAYAKNQYDVKLAAAYRKWSKA